MLMIQGKTRGGIYKSSVKSGHNDIKKYGGLSRGDKYELQVVNLYGFSVHFLLIRLN